MNIPALNKKIPWTEEHQEMLLIFFLAFSIRLIHHFLIRKNFWFKALLVDDRIYDDWARRILNGDWLLISKGPFRFNPGYPYFLAVLYRLTGSSIESVVFIQHEIGSLSCVLIYWLGKELFDRPIGRLAGISLALYGPGLLYEDRLLATCPLVCVNLLILCLLIQGRRRSSRWMWFFTGFFCGVSWLFIPAILFFVAGVVVLRLWNPENQPGIPSLGMVFLGGLLFTLGPALVRNAVLEREWHLPQTTTAGGFGFFIGNNPESDGADRMPSFTRYTPFSDEDFAHEAERRLGRSLSPFEVSHYWLVESLRWIIHSPIDYARLLGKKLLHLVDDFELHDDFPRDQIAPFEHFGRIPLLRWGIIFPLGIAGMILSWPLRKKIVELELYTLCALGFVLLFYVLERYRFPAVPGLILFASFAVMETKRRMEARRFTSLTIPGLVFFSLLLVSYGQASVHAGDEWSNHITNAAAYASGGRIQDALGEYQMALQMNPSLTCRNTVAGQIARLGQSCFEHHDYSGAVVAFEYLVKIQPEDAKTQMALGVSRWNAGKPLTEALDAMARAEKLDPKNRNYKRIYQMLQSQADRRTGDNLEGPRSSIGRADPS